MKRVIPLVIPLLLLLLMDYFNINLLSGTSEHYHLILIYLSIHIFGYVGLLLAVFNFRRSPLERSIVINFIIGLGFAVITKKFVLFILSVVFSFILFIGIDGSKGIIQLVLFGISLVPLFAMIYGIIWGKYRFKRELVQIKFGDLPEAFDGFKIVQISDVHSGTWDSISGVDKGIRLIEDQNADMVVFTGDLVNSDKNEIDPYIHLFKRLKAPYGKYAILGNHDYYGQPRERTLREAYYDDFFSKYKEMGFDLILNDSRGIVKGDHTLRLVGVENWGSGRFFPKRGDLDLASKNCQPSDFSILLSHDPSHWDMMALAFPQHFHLTLSGHTHGMQFGINLPFFKWSPVQYRYKKWMGLYEENGQYLYVNRGFGLLAFPGRVGMSPEVTVIELRRSRAGK